MITLEQLRAEYRAQTMGPLIVERIRGLVTQQLRHRDPQIYAGGAHDYRDGLEDVLNNFTVDVLLEEGQLAYFFETATTIDEFERLTNFQIRRYLARTRERTIVDNLIERAVVAMRADDVVEVSGTGRSERFRRTEVGEDESPIDDSALRDAAGVASNCVPRIFTNPDDRNPKVYSDEDLGTLLRIFLGELACTVTRTELQSLFEILLTPWLTTVLGLDEAVNARPKELGPDDESVVQTLAAGIAAAWTDKDVIVFRYKLSNTPDSQLATRLGVSRPTAANAKSSLFDELRDQLQDLDTALQPHVIARLATLTDGVLP